MRVIVSFVADLEGVVDRVTLRALDDVTDVGVSDMGVATLILLGARVVLDGAIPEEHNDYSCSNVTYSELFLHKLVME